MGLPKVLGNPDETISSHLSLFALITMGASNDKEAVPEPEGPDLPLDILDAALAQYKADDLSTLVVQP